MGYREQKRHLLEGFAQQAIGKNRWANSRKLRHNLAKLVDQTLLELWDQFHLAQQQDICLVAVGGYGRGELFPCSDIDVLVLLSNRVDLTSNLHLQNQIESFIRACWDVGLEIGSSVRCLSDCLEEAAKDITVQTALLESRRVSLAEKSNQGGSPQALLYKAFKASFSASLDHKGFARSKLLEMTQRHNKFENTPYALEPNCKESPGGLRDLHVILWLTKAAGYGSSWRELANSGLATSFEAKQLHRNENVLATIRIWLHILAKRREDRLVFDLQTQVAEKLGFAFQSTRARSEALMHDYYWAAKAVVQLNQILLLNINERLNPLQVQPIALTEDFFDQGGFLDIVSDDLYRRRPQAILQTFSIFQKTRGISALSARCLRALYNARPLMNAQFRRDPANRATFLSIIQTDHRLTHTLRLMNQTSVLGRYLWAFRRIVGQMQHDLFHVYTVDQHILMVVRNVRRFFIADHAHEYPMCSELAGNWDKPWILYVAALFHDIAKGRGGDHSELGVVDALSFCKQHGIASVDAQLIAFLVKEHLTMSHIAQKQDLSDPEVTKAFANRVQSPRYLTALYLLTIADIRGTSPKVWNAWKGKLLEDLYRHTKEVLGGSTPDAASLVEGVRQKALHALNADGLSLRDIQPLWDTLDVSYFMRHESSEVVWQTRLLIQHVGSSRAIVRARLSPIGEGLQVVVYTPEHSNLFARICGYFERQNFTILDAKIHTTHDAHVLDSFQVVPIGAFDDARESWIEAIQKELTQALQAQPAFETSPTHRPTRRARHFPIQPQIRLHPDERAQRWILSITATDRVGLLHDVGCILAKHHVNLQLAKIATLGERIEDTFLVDGDALQNPKTVLLLETDLLNALQK